MYFKGFPHLVKLLYEFRSPIFFRAFWGRFPDPKPPCKGELPTGSGCLPKKSPVTCRWISFLFGGTKENPIRILMVKKPDIFSDFFVGRFFSTTIMVSKKKWKDFPPPIFFSPHNMLSFQKEMHKKLSCSAQLTSTLFCHVSCLKSGIRFSSIVLDFFCLNFLGVSKFFHQLEGCELTNLWNWNLDLPTKGIVSLKGQESKKQKPWESAKNPPMLGFVWTCYSPSPLVIPPQKVEAKGYSRGV